jgi:hypothetical protein
MSNGESGGSHSAWKSGRSLIGRVDLPFKCLAASRWSAGLREWAQSIWDQEFFFGDKFFRLFLSHTHPHAKAMTALKWELLSYRVVAFVAHEDIEPG